MMISIFDDTEIIWQSRLPLDGQCVNTYRCRYFVLSAASFTHHDLRWPSGKSFRRRMTVIVDGNLFL